MANKIRIDTRLLDVNWTTGTTYKLAIGAGLVREVGNNRSFSPAQATTSTTSTVFSAKTFTTFDSGPTITAVTPALNTTESFATTATITFNRTIYDKAAENFYLYKEVDGPDELIATLNTASSRVTRVANTITIDLKNLVDSSSTYYLQSSNPLFTDMFNFPNENLSETKFKYTTGRPNIEFVTPTFNTVESFATTAVINFDRNIKKRSGDILLYKETLTTPELISTLSTTSNRVSVSDDQIVIDLKDLVDGNGTYYLESDYGFVDDTESNFRAEPVTDQKFRYTTGRPNIDDVIPDYLTTGSFVTNPVVSFTRDVKKRTGNFYLYKKTSGADLLVQTFNTSDSRILIDIDDVSFDLRYLLQGNSTYYLASDAAVLDDAETNFRAEQISESNFKYSTGPGPVPVSVTPFYGSTGTFVSTATITFDKPISLYSNTVYLYKNNNVYRTLAVGSSNLQIVNGNTLQVTLYDQPIPEDIYYIGFDLGTVVDANTFSAKPIDDDSLVKWTSKSITDIANDNYNSRITTPIFENNWFNVLDRSPADDEQYTLTMSATSGTFTATGGISVGNTWIYTGTNQQISNIGGVNFIADVKDMNWDLPIETTLKKQGTLIATRNNTIIGLPYDLDSMPLVSNTFTNSVGSSTVLTVTANTNSAISTQVTFRTSSTVLGTSTFVNNVASLTLLPNTISTGSYNIFASWAGQILVPKFNGRNSNVIQQSILPKSPSTVNLSIPNLPYILRPEVGTGTNPLPILSANISGIYPTHLASGEVLLREGLNLLGSGILSSSATTNISWNPETYNQLDTGNRNLTVSYSGDFWNNTGSNTIIFNGKLRNSISLSVSALSSNIVRPDNAVLRVVSNNSNFSGKSIKWYEGSTLLGISTFTGFTSSIVLNSYNLDIGQNSTFAIFDGDYNFENTTTNTIFYNVSKRTPLMSISYSPTQLSISTTSFTVNITGLVSPAPSQNLVLSVISTSTSRINSPALEYGSVNEVNQWAAGYIVLGAEIDSSLLSYVNTSTFNVDSGDDLDIYINDELQDMLLYYRYNNEIIGTKGFWKIIRVISPNKIALQAWVDINGTRIPFNQSNDPNVTEAIPSNSNLFPLTKWLSQTVAPGQRAISIRGVFSGNLQAGDILGTSSLSSSTTQVVFPNIAIPSGRYGIRASINSDDTYNFVSTTTFVNKRL
jgi:hypothetical protein